MHTQDFLLDILKKFINFSLIGGIGLLINLVVTFIMKEFFGLWYYWSFLIGVLFTWTFIFLANSNFTFHGHSKEKYFKKYVKFLLIYFCIFLINASLVFVFTSVLSVYYLLSIIMATVITTILTFSFSWKFVFRY
jgi:putative flippase GtrA